MGDTVVANVRRYTTFPATRNSLKHMRNILLYQYMVSGKEQFGVLQRDGLDRRRAQQEASDLANHY